MIIDESEGHTPAEILTSERQTNPDTKLTSQDIYNAKKLIRKKKLGRYTPTQALLKALHRDRWFVKVKLRKHTNEVKRMFFVDKNVAKILSQNSEVLYLDCTYKTNKYKMPLMTIAGQTALGTTFLIGFAFLSNEKQGNFEWVLEQLKDLYKSLGLKDPNVVVNDCDEALMNALDVALPEASKLLCIWHINKNVASYCKRGFGTEEDWTTFETMWANVVNAPTSEECAQAWSDILNKYESSHPQEVNYLYKTWLLPWSERFCKCETNKILHFGATTTSRVEGMHRVLKRYLKFSTGDLMTVVDKIELMLTNQYKNYFAKLAVAKRDLAWEFQRTVFRDLTGRVTPHALWKIHDRYSTLKRATEAEPLAACTHAFTRTMGLPCSHIIEARMNAVDEELGRIPIDDVHPHWRFRKPDTEISAGEEFSSDVAAIAQVLRQPMGDENDEDAEDAETLDQAVANASLAPDVNVEDVDEDFDLEETERKANELLRSLRRNARIERPTPDPQDSVDEDLNDPENVELLGINEPRVMKEKGRPKGSTNKKGLMTNAQKKAANSTRRDPSRFEHVEASIQAARGGGRSRGRGRGPGRVNTTSARGGHGATTARGGVTSKARKGRKASDAPLTWSQKVQALKDEAKAEKAKRQQELDAMDADIRAIEEEDVAIKRSVRAMMPVKHSDETVLGSDFEATEHEVGEHQEEAGDHAEDPMELSSNTDSDYNMDSDGEITGDMNMN